MTLYTALLSTSSSSTIKGLKVGQVFRTHDGNDFSDGAMLAWKQYDYDADATLAANDLYMYCGMIEREDGNTVPVLRFLGISTQSLLQPAFAYGIKEGSNKLYKISLTTTVDDDAFDGTTATTLTHSGGDDEHTVTNTGSRITSLSLGEWEGNYISAFSLCTSPPIFNTIGLADSGADPHTTSSNIFHTNGNLKIYYRSGVFYIAARNKKNQLYRLNAIDFHSLTITTPKIESLLLNFNNIPDQLYAEDGNGIVQRTMEDTVAETALAENNEYDSKFYGWSNIPSDAHIIGICETFENGNIRLLTTTAADEVINHTFTGHTNAYVVTTQTQSRLTTGDKVRFARMDIATSPDSEGANNKNFNVAPPYEVNAINNGTQFIIDTESATKVPTIRFGDNVSNRCTRWWNAKVWVLYRRNSLHSSFNKWDLFLYNANTLDITSSQSLNMADRTPPYHQVRYYTTTYSQNDKTNKVYYPAEFAFIKNRFIPGAETWDADAEVKPYNLQLEHISKPGANIDSPTPVIGTMQANDVSFSRGNWLSQWGIYDKSGRWAENGIDFYPASNDMVEDATGHGYYLYKQLSPYANGLEALRKFSHQQNSNMEMDSPYGDDFGFTANGSLEGQLLWGQNIGWSIERERSISTIKNSLHPLVPYSSLWMGSIAYPGHDKDEGNFDTTSIDYTTMLESGAIARSNNRPKHAVTFLGKVDGDFIQQPALLERNLEIMQDISDNGGWVDSRGYGTTDYEKSYFVWHHLPFRVSSDSLLNIKKYRNDITLFTIDDFSGHRGCVQYQFDDLSLDFTAVTDGTHEIYPKSGIDVAMPNWGGPEIENPRTKAYIHYGVEEGTETHNIGTHSSVNGGYINPNDSTTDKGWEGYTPPYLFNPGNGYYVYINRTWTSMLPHNGFYGQSETHKPTFAWGFQIAGQPHGKYPLHAGNRNRWHNFSNTAIADGYTQVDGNQIWHAGLVNPGGFATEDSWTSNEELISSRFSLSLSRSETQNWADYDTHGVDSTLLYNNPYITTMPSTGQSICTMHRINIPGIKDINNVIPVILDSNVTLDFTGNQDFHCGYICGIKKPSGQSGALVLRTNFDFLWDKISNVTATPGSPATSEGSQTGKAYIGLIEVPRPYTTVTLQATDNGNSEYDLVLENAFGDPIYRNLPYAFRGTHVSETMDITDDLTNYTTSFQTEEVVMRQAALNTYSSTLLGENLTILPQRPYLPLSTHADEHDWFVNVNSVDNSSIYFGYEANHFAQDNRAADALAVYDEDSGGTFNNTTIFSGSGDTTILTTATAMLSFPTLPDEGDTGNIVEGDYYYKVAYEYDSQFESPLHTGGPILKTVTPSTAGKVFDYIEIKISIPSDVIDNISKRITGISVYRKFGGGDEDEYNLLKFVEFDGDWFFDSSLGEYTKTILDTGALSGTYISYNGVPSTIEDTSLNYGLSVIAQGYMYVTKAWHKSIDDIRRYIFRSMPNNYFTFNHLDDFVIMPEEIKAMVYFNSRLYAWGEQKLYKIDPFNLVIEDEYEGVSILNKYSYVKTEYGLCFMDANNIYIHDGNTPHPIGNDILYATDRNIVYESHADGEIDVIETVVNGDSDDTLPTLGGQALSGAYMAFPTPIAPTDEQASPNDYNDSPPGDNSFKCITGNSVSTSWIYWPSSTECGLVNGKTYTISAYVWIPVHNEVQEISQLKLGYMISGSGIQTLDSTTDIASWVKLEGTFVADSNVSVSFLIQALAPVTAPFTANYFYIDQLSVKSFGDGISDGHIVLEQGYRDLVKFTQSSGTDANPSMHYSGIKNSFIILSVDRSGEGKAFIYNLLKKRWDFWDAPKSIASSSSKNNEILIADGDYLWNYLNDTSVEPDRYARRQWDWFSKNINFGIDNQEKVFKTLSFTGMPCYYDYKDIEGAVLVEELNVNQITGIEGGVDLGEEKTRTASIQAFVDEVPVTLTVMNKFYDTTSKLNTIIKEGIDDEEDILSLYTNAYPMKAGGGVWVDIEILGNTYDLQKQQDFIRAGMYIKVNDEIMFIKRYLDNSLVPSGTNVKSQAFVERGVLGTTAAEHTANTSVYIISPKMKFPSATKGNRLQIRFFKQEGHIDSVAVSYKPKTIK